MGVVVAMVAFLGTILLIGLYRSRRTNSGANEHDVVNAVEQGAAVIRTFSKEESEAMSKVRESSEYLDSGQHEKAVEILSSVLKTFPNHFGAYINRGLAYDKLGDYEKAMKDFHESIRINPTYYIAHINLASVYRELGKKEESLKLYNEVLSIIPPERQGDISEVKRMINEL